MPMPAAACRPLNNPSVPFRKAIVPLVAVALLAACSGSDTASTSAADGLMHTRALAIASPAQSRWGPVQPLSIAPSSIANLPDGKVLMFFADVAAGGWTGNAQTMAVTYDPLTGTSVPRTVTETGHNMFCPEISNLPDGRIMVNGGNTPGASSVYDQTTNLWTRGDALKAPRGYGSNVSLQDGSVFTLGGSWSGIGGTAPGEVWTQGSGWRAMSGLPIAPFKSQETTGWYADSFLWMFAAGNGRVLHAGPGRELHWIDTSGNGAYTSAGTRGDDVFSQSGSAVMYDIGKILKAGGGLNQQTSNPRAYVIDTTVAAMAAKGSALPTVTRTSDMAYNRAWHNSVVLPNGQVVVLGGLNNTAEFTDTDSRLVPELWDPDTGTFTALPPMGNPRNYHSVAALLPDGRVLSAGNNNSDVNGKNMQIWSPHYLFNADGSAAVRPVITSAPTTARYGNTLAIKTDSAVSKFVLVRLSSTTHSLQNNQRRVPLTFTSAGNNTWQVNVPTNPGNAPPGLYMLFGMNASGVPSIAKTLRLGNDGAPSLANPGDQFSALNAAVNLSVATTNVTSYSATGLPPGLAIDAVTGKITGSTTTAGSYAVSVLATNASATVSTDWVWTVSGLGNSVVPLNALATVGSAALPGDNTVRLTTVGGQAGAAWAKTPWSTTAGFSFSFDYSLQGTGNNQADGVSFAMQNSGVGSIGNGGGDLGLNGMPGTWLGATWQTYSNNRIGWVSNGQGFNTVQAAPLALGNKNSVTGTAKIAYDPTTKLLRLDATGSADGQAYSTSATRTVDLQATFGNTMTVGFTGGTGGVASVQTISNWVNTGGSSVNRPPVMAVTPATRSSALNQSVSEVINATDADGDALSYSATNLPTGLSINATSGQILGVPTAAGAYATTVSANDGRGGIATVNIAWTVVGSAITIGTPSATPVVSGSTATFNANTTGATAGALYSWSFGDGTATTAYSSLGNTAHVYTAPGLYTVVLTVKEASGVVSTRSFTQAVYATNVGTTLATQSSPISVEARVGANARVWVVNQDNDTVSVFDAVTNTKQAEIAVGSAPRSVAVAPDGRIWVTNKQGNSISILSPTSLTVVQTLTTTLPRASQPHGLAFAPNGSAAYVALEATGQLLKLNPSTGAVLATLSVGANARHLAITPASDRVLVSRFITPPLPGEGTATVTTAGQGGQVVVVTAATLVIERTVLLQHSDKADESTRGAGIPNYLVAAAISPDGKSAWVSSKQDNIKRGTLRNGSNLDFQNTVRAISSRVDLSTWAEDYAARQDFDNSGVASAAVYHPTGAYLFVALQTSRQVAVVDPVGKRTLFNIDTGLAPDGVVLSANGLKLFVNNFMGRTVGIYDLSRLINNGQADATGVTLLASPSSVTTEKLAADVLKGKQFFYDAKDTRLARDAYMSCASCHNDGSHDGRTWDFTGLGEGLRNTISLIGRAGAQGNKHWSGNFDEIQDFEGQIRSFAQGTGLMTDVQFNTGTRNTPLGDTKAGVSADLDALAAYVKSRTTFVPSPARDVTGALTAAAVLGKTVFAANCASCHGGDAFTVSASANLMDVGTLKASSGKRLGGALSGIDVPTLRDVWATAPYLHDGSAATVADAILAHKTFALSAADLASVTAFTLQIGSEEAAVSPAGGGGTGTGLTGQYYNSNDLTGAVVLTRTEVINFNWGSGSPAAVVNADNFSVRWSGTVQAPTSGSYKFQTYTDDGLRLTVNGVRVIDNWTPHGPTADTSATMTLQAGTRYNIVMEYQELGGGAVAQLSWLTPGATAYAVVPASNLYGAAVTPPAASGSSPLFGSTAIGTAFNDVASTTQVLNGISVRAGSWLDSIQGLGAPVNWPQHGGNGGGLYTVIWPTGEYLVRISGQVSGNVIGQISFVTNTGRSYGPYGSTTGTAFDYTAPTGSRILSLKGYSDGYLRAIGVTYGP